MTPASSRRQQGAFTSSGLGTFSQGAVMKIQDRAGGGDVWFVVNVDHGSMVGGRGAGGEFWVSVLVMRLRRAHVGLRPCVHISMCVHTVLCGAEEGKRDLWL